MELVNLLIIIVMTSVCLFWALRKRREIETTTINFNQADNAFNQGSDGEQNLAKDQEDLAYTANLFQDAVEAMLKKIHFLCLCIFGVMGIIVWVSFEFLAFICYFKAVSHT